MSKKSSTSGRKDPSRGKGALVENYRERELIYERGHAQDLLQYAGRWVALEGETVIASRASLTETIADARSHGIKTPYVFFVSSDDAAELGL